MNSSENKLIIAIDGYSSSGKSTFAKAIAKKLRYIYIDSGAMYRAVTLESLRRDIIHDDTIDREKLRILLDEIAIRFRFNPQKECHETFLGEENIEKEIRTILVSQNVSQISKIKMVRVKLVTIQQEMGKNKGIVMDGRDIGTVVFPNADYKIFMTASVDIRAERRYKELIEKGMKASFDDVRENIIQRDRIDENREESPLRKADDAIVLDNSHMTPDEQLVWFFDILRKNGYYEN